MKKVILGKTGIAASKPAMGCLPIQRCTEDDAVELLQKAYEGGINFFDTANAYSDSEKKIGIALSDVRKNIFLATKSKATSRDGIYEHIENSLKLFNTDYIDLFQIHQMSEMPDFDDPKGAYAGMIEAKREGLIRHIGFSAHRIDVAEKAVESGMFETCMFPFSYISSERDINLAEKCEENDMGFIAMKGLAGGLLTNVKACHAFMNGYSNVVPIWGIQSMEELLQWLEAAESDYELTDELNEFISREKLELAGSFCRGCGYCMPCSVGIDIRMCARMSMMIKRSPWQKYMTEEWYNKMQKIKDCIHCGACASRCPYELDTPSLLVKMLEDYNSFYAAHGFQKTIS